MFKCPDKRVQRANDIDINMTYIPEHFVSSYSIHVPGWLQKWLNLITAPGSVSNEPGSVTWLATKYLKTVSWRNHTEKLTTWWPQNISFWPKINIPSSYFTILMLNCLENTLKLQFDSYVTVSDSRPNQFQNNLNLTWPSNTAGISLDSRLEYSKITHRYAKVSPFTWFLCWKLPIDTDFIHFICHFHQAVTAWECFDQPAALQQGMLGALIVWRPASFWLQWTMADGTMHTGSPAKFPTKPTEEWKKNRKMYAIKQIKICAEYRDMLPRPRLDLSGTPRLRPIGLSPGSWQTSLGLGSMSRYSAQILICIPQTQILRSLAEKLVL